MIRTLLLLLGLAALGPAAGWLDVPVRDAVQHARQPWLEGPAQLLSNRLGRPDVTLGVLLAFCVFGGPAGVETAQLSVATLLPVNAVVEAVKRLTFRTRPDGDHKRSNASYPSSHSANVFAIAAVLARRSRRFAVPMWILAVCMAGSRIYLDRHWFSDVVVGAAVGLILARYVAAWWTSHRGVRTPPESVERGVPVC